MIIAGTGHRPDKLGGYGEAAADRVYKHALSELRRIRPTSLISGMALGWDQALAQAALDLSIPLLAYIPFRGQQNRWPSESQHHFNTLVQRATLVKVVCEGDYAAWKMNKRNEAMVDACDAVLALWNGTSGGTANCVFYAKRQKKRLHNCWDKFVINALQREML